MKGETGQFLSRLYRDFFIRDRITRQDWIISIPPFWTRILNLFQNFHLLMEIVAKTALPNSIFKFNSSFLLLFSNYICEIESTNVFWHLQLNVLNYLRKAATQNLFCYLFFKVLVMHWIYCYVLDRIIKKPSGRIIFSNFAS